MKKFLISLISFVLVIVSCFAFTGCSDNSDLQDKITALEDKISSLEDDNSSLLDEIDALKDINNAKLPDFADCEIGYELEVYPKVAFSYKVNEDCIVHIESISATLTAKNVINEGDVLEEAFYPYLVTVKVFGNTSPERAGKKVGFVFLYGTSTYSRLMGTIIGEYDLISDNGTFEAITEIRCTNNSIVYFEQAMII